MITQTLLPPPSEVYDSLCVKIINLPLTHNKTENNVTTTLNIKSNTDGSTTPVVATLYTIADDIVGEYLPSRVWFSSEYGVTLLYYVSSTLPSQVRPFKNGKSYVLVIPIDDILDVVDYDADLRLLIDQVETPSGISYVIMFADDVYEKLIT